MKTSLIINISVFCLLATGMSAGLSASPGDLGCFQQQDLGSGLTKTIVVENDPNIGFPVRKVSYQLNPHYTGPLQAYVQGLECPGVSAAYEWLFELPPLNHNNERIALSVIEGLLKDLGARLLRTSAEGVFVIRLPKTLLCDSLLTKINKIQDILSEQVFDGNTLGIRLEPNFLFSVASSVNASHTSGPASWGLARIQNRQVHEYASSGDYDDWKSVKVAVLDTGIYEHPLLRNSLWDGPVGHKSSHGKCFVYEHDGVERSAKFISDPVPEPVPDPVECEDGFKTDDNNGHGTAVAGVVAADPASNWGADESAVPIQVMAIKVLNSRGYGTGNQVADGLRWAAANGAQVLSLSLDGRCTSVALEEVLAELNGKASGPKALVVSAAGNDNLDLDLEGSCNSFPACYGAKQQYKNFIVVGATDENDDLALGTNYGSAVDIGAPGTNIWSLGRRPNSNSFCSGTSMAVPFVSRAAATLISASSTQGPSIIKQVLLNNSDPVHNLLKWWPKGDRRLNLFRALSAFLNMNYSASSLDTVKQPTGSCF